MKAEELAFVNQQLAAMLRNGIPLESALGQLCTDMRHGTLRHELERLHADLTTGIPFEQAVAARGLPAFYVQMLRVGAKSNDLPGVLTLVADYYQRASLLQMRLKGLMAYPVIVLIATLALSTWLTFLLHGLRANALSDLFEGMNQVAPVYVALVWTPPLLLALTVMALVIGLSVPAVRQWLRWRLPAVRESNLGQAAAALTTMVSSGCTLADSISLLQQLEGTSPAGRELAHWLDNLRGGQTSFSAIAGGGRAFPPLFVSLVANARDNIADGFRQAAAVYEMRAAYLSEMVLQAALPAAIITVGALLTGQLLSSMLIISRCFMTLGS